MENFGIYSNYAYVDSSIKEFQPWWDPMPGGGFVEDTATLDLWYSGEKLEVRLGYSYHSEYSLIAWAKSAAASALTSRGTPVSSWNRLIRRW